MFQYLLRNIILPSWESDTLVLNLGTVLFEVDLVLTIIVVQTNQVKSETFGGYRSFYPQKLPILIEIKALHILEPSNTYQTPIPTSYLNLPIPTESGNYHYNHPEGSPGVVKTPEEESERNQGRRNDQPESILEVGKISEEPERRRGERPFIRSSYGLAKPMKKQMKAWDWGNGQLEGDLWGG